MLNPLQKIRPFYLNPPKLLLNMHWQISRLLIKTLQRILFSISPAILHEFGLNASLEWLCKEFSALYDIPCVFKTAYDEQRLTGKIKTDFSEFARKPFRILLTMEMQ